MYEKIIDWLVAAGIEGEPECDLLPALGERLIAAGIPLLRLNVYQPTLHPMIGGHIFVWWRGESQAEAQPWNRQPSDSASRAEPSPFDKMIQDGEMRVRLRLSDADLSGRPLLQNFKDKGATDYLALQCRFGEAHTVGPVDRILTSWLTDNPDGFTDAQLAGIERIAPALALAAKGGSTHRIVKTVIAVYLGEDAGRRVLRGSIERGAGESIRAALWSCDLQGFTKLADTVPRDQLMALLDDYFDCMVSALHAEGGQVLKFLGDGLLAIFNQGDDAQNCGAALNAAEKVQDQVEALTARRRAAGLPVSHFYIALHLGEVLFGNIGAQDRLDFTVVGPAVNEVARIEAMCRSLDQNLVISSTFAGACVATRQRLVSLGRYALRGVQRPQELFTLDRFPAESVS